MNLPEHRYSFIAQERVRRPQWQFRPNAAPQQFRPNRPVNQDGTRTRQQLL
jgi:hypothetical protein